MSSGRKSEEFRGAERDRTVGLLNAINAPTQESSTVGAAGVPEIRKSAEETPVSAGNVAEVLAAVRVEIELIEQRLANIKRAVGAGQSLVTVEHAAAILGVNPQTVRRLCRAKKLRHVRIGALYRIDPRDLIGGLS